MAFVGATWGGNSFWIRMLFHSFNENFMQYFVFYFVPRNNLQAFCRRRCRMTGLYLFVRLSRSIRSRGDVSSISKRQSFVAQIAKIKETLSDTVVVVKEINCDTQEDDKKTGRT